MRNVYLSVSMCLLTLGSLFAQNNMFLRSPSGYTYPNDVNKLSVSSVPGPSASVVNQIISGEHPKSGEMYIVAQNMPTNLNMQNAGVWTTYNGFKTWRLKIKSPGAEAIALLYSTFRIPESAVVYVYNSSFSHKSRPYLSSENPNGEHFATEVIVGDETILEYWVPDTETETADIQIEAVSHVFREGQQFMPRNWQQNGDSDPCQVNANCSEGNNWQDQKRGVAKIYVVEGSSGGLCSGTLINNTAQDCKNYFLTAQHCGAGASAANMNQWVFYFNFEAPTCANISDGAANGVDNQTRTGCTKRASSGTNSNVNHSDFLLVEFNSAIPTDYNVYYNGWDRNNTAATSGVGIHHPSGDIKKISTYSSSLQSTNWSGTPSGSHWRVNWVGTANGHGVTEGGSSGSPIFNQSKRIVGDLSGGSSYCNSVQPGGQNQPDLYGKFSYSWETVGANNNQRLKPWLDPSGTNATTLDGKNACGSTPPPVGTCDTASNFNLNTHTPSMLTVPGGTGWLAGSNSYGDKAKTEYFANTFPANSQLKAFYLYFHTASGSGNVTFKVWDATGSGGAPGTVLAQGTTPMANIPSNGNAILFDLSANPINVPANGFHIGFEIPSAGGTNIGLYTTAANQVATNTGWEQYSDNSWHSYLESYNNRYANAVYAVVCPPSQTAVAPVANFTANLTSIPVGANVNFTQTSTNNPTTFAWSVSPNTGISYQSGTTSASANPVIRFNTAGQYTISLTASNAAGADNETKTNYITVTNSGVGINENMMDASIKVYPNPANDFINIDIEKLTTDNISINVIDMLGKTVYSTQKPAGTQSMQIPMETLAKGIYQIEIRTGNYSNIQKVIKN